MDVYEWAIVSHLTVKTVSCQIGFKVGFLGAGFSLIARLTKRPVTVRIFR